MKLGLSFYLIFQFSDASPETLNFFTDYGIALLHLFISQ